MRKQNQKWKTMGRRMLILLLLCGLLLPNIQYIDAATISYKYEWIVDASGLPTDDQWHDYFIAWEDLDDKAKVWFADYHWYTPDGYNNYDAGGSHWMEYKAASTLPDYTSKTFTSRDMMGHMQIKYAGRDPDNGNSPKYYIRVSKVAGGYAYFTRYEPTNDESDADAFTFQDKGDVFHIFVNISGKADRYLTRDGQNLETTESSSYGGGAYYRPLRVYKRSTVVDETVNDSIDEITGKVTMYEYNWINTVEELYALANAGQWVDVILAWEDATSGSNNDRSTVWYTKEVWYDNGVVNYRNDSTEYLYWSNACLGSDGFSSAYADSFVLDTPAGHFQMKGVGWDTDNEVKGVKGDGGAALASPIFQIRFHVGHNRYFYFGNDHFEESASDALDYTVQLFLEADKKNNADYYYGSTHIFRNIGGGWVDDEYLTRQGNRLDVSNHNASKSWEFPFRIYSRRTIEYDAILQSFTIGKGASYSIDGKVILNKGVTITVEDGGVLTVDKDLLNNGQIIVKEGGVLIVNEGGCIMPYSETPDGSITIDGGNMIIMEDASVVMDKGEGALMVRNGATIINYGVLMVSRMLELRNNSCLMNKETGHIIFGGIIAENSGRIDTSDIKAFESRLENVRITLLCTTKSRLYNEGTLSFPSLWLSNKIKLNIGDNYFGNMDMYFREE